MTEDLVSAMPFSSALGLKLKEASETRVVGTLEVSEGVTTTGDLMHGGALMAVADTLGAIGAFLTLPEGAGGTTTIESKTNFLGAARVGMTITATATPVHVGKRTSVWQTRIERDDGRPVALVTQTQLVL
ncbi:MAG: PaaI family thioesterase [Pseudomonadota bacterium]